MERPNPFTIFKSIQWQGFRNIILKDLTVRRLMKEVQDYRESGYASTGNPGEWLDRIMYIRGNSAQATSTYTDMFKKYGRCEMLH
jgi:hypothetical protein